MRNLLSPDALVAALRQRPEWAGDATAIRRTATLPSFRAAVAAVVEVADAAEELDHHPDMDIRWRTLTFTLSTHSAGGVTELDLALADRIDSAVTERSSTT